MTVTRANRILSWGAAMMSLACCVAFVVSKAKQDRVPRIHIGQETIDLGVVDAQAPNVPTRVSFEIMNHGSAPLELIGLDLGCACLKARLNKEALLPGETTQLTARVVLPTRLGPFSQSIVLHSNDPEHPTKRLCIKALLHSDCFVLPESLTIRRLRIGEERTVAVHVTGPPGDSSFTVRNVTASSKEIALRSIEEAVSGTDSSRPVWRVTMTVGARGVNEWDDTVVIGTTDSEKAILKIPIKISEMDAVQCSPPLVILRRESTTNNLVGRVRLSSNLNKAITIAGFEKPGWLHVLPARDIYDLPTELHLTRRDGCSKMTNGSVQTELRVILRGDAPTVKIPILLAP